MSSLKSMSAADLQDAIVALIHRVHAEESYKQVGQALTTEFYHRFKRQIAERLREIRSYLFVENFDVSVSPYPGDSNDVLTTVALRMMGKVFTANLRMSHGIWLYKVWNTPLPELHVTDRVDPYAREIVDAAIKSTVPQWSSGSAVDLSDPDSLKAHGITDLSQ